LKLALAQALCLALTLGAVAQDPIIPAVQPDAGQVAVKVTPASLDFGTQPVGTTSPSQTATLSNAGNSAVIVRRIIASGIDFDQTSNCGATLAAGAQCTIQITFKPAITGPRTGNLTLVVSGSTRPCMIALNGTGE
jgi:hypothetical protein